MKAVGSHPIISSQTKSGGKALQPAQKSATARETTNALVLFRSRLLLQTRKIIKPFPVMDRMERDQPRIQNHVSILWSSGGQPNTNESWKYKVWVWTTRLQKISKGMHVCCLCRLRSSHTPRSVYSLLWMSAVVGKMFKNEKIVFMMFIRRNTFKDTLDWEVYI